MTRRCFLFLFLLVSTALMALDPDKTITQYTVQVWNIESGLPGNSVLALHQTRDGFLWIGTQDGLVRFDGIKFQLFSRGNIPQLTNNEIRALYEDGTGTLWIGTCSGGLTRFKQGEFITYSTRKHDYLHRISAICGDRRGNLWIGSVSKGLTYLNNGKFTNYTTKQGLPHNQVGNIYKDKNRDLWVTTAGGIVKILEPGNFRVYAPPNRLPYFKTASLYDTDTGTLWIGTGKGGLFRMKNDVITGYGADVGIPQRPITSLYRDSMKNLWIGTDGGGLTRMSNGIFSTLRGNDGLADGFVYPIIQDREGSLWVGTLDGGLHQLRDDKFTTYTTREGLAHDYSYCIHEARDGSLWIGTKGGLSVLRSKTGKPFTELFNNVVSAIYEDPAGRFWIGTWEGLHRFNNGKHTIITKKDGLCDNRISFILGDSRGNTWIGTRHGLNRIDAGSNRITVFTNTAGSPGNIIQFIFEDSKGNLLIGTDAGLNTVKDDALTTYPLTPTGREIVFRCAHEDNQGVLRFGTDSGLIRMASSASIYTYTLQSGLTEGDIYSILEDENGYLWLAGRNGVSRVKIKELEDFSQGKIARVRPETYNEKDGMKSRWCIGPAYKTRDGKFWFPTSVGVAMIDPNQIKTNPTPPPLMIEKIIIDGKTIKSFSGGPGRFAKRKAQGAKRIHDSRYAQSSMRYAPSPLALEIPPGMKRLEFYYTAVSFIKPDRIKFRIKLKGYDEDWVDMGTSRNATYTGLSPGNYIFKVTACNPDGVRNEEGVSFSFYLKPHWYKTWWAFVLYVIFFFFGVFFFVSRRSSKLKKEKKRLEQMVKERTREINEKNLQLQEQSEKLKELDQAKSRFFANISHEFRTPLTLIMGPLEQRLSTCRDKEQQEEMNIMLRNSRRLLNLVNQLLELARLESSKIKLKTSRQNIVPFIKSIAMCFESLARQNRIELIFQTETDDISLYFDTEHLEKIITNLLSNAFNHTPAGGKIRVSVRRLTEAAGFPGGCVQVSVHNTGIGLPRDQLGQIFDRFYRGTGDHQYKQKGTGIGLALTKELISLHHGEITVDSREGKNSWVEFIICLPLGKEHLKADEIVRVSPYRLETNPQYSFDNGALDMMDQTESGAEAPGDEEKNGQARVEPAAAADPGEKDVILVVEDNTDVRAYIRKPLQSHYIVEEAENGRQGIEKAKEIIPDLIISDIMMPEKDGYQLCQELKNDIKTSHIPIILLTAKASEENVLQGLETGADDYITKPFNRKILMSRIKNLVELRRQLHQKIKRQMLLQPENIPVSSMDEGFLKEMQQVIEENLGDPEFDVVTLSRKLYQSQSTLYRKIRALTGESPKQFILSYRLKRAAQLLKANFGNVTEVALEVGFSSSSYFARRFKEKFHRLPHTFMTAEAEKSGH